MGSIHSENQSRNIKLLKIHSEKDHKRWLNLEFMTTFKLVKYIESSDSYSLARKCY